MIEIAKKIEKAKTLISAGFKSEAEKKKCLVVINSAYDALTSSVYDGGILNSLLEMFPKEERNETFNSLYWNIPSLHHWKEKHSESYREFFPEEVKKIELLVEMRKLVKNMPITKIEKPEIVDRVEKIQKSIREELEYRKIQYEEGMDLAKIVGPNVTANVHLVHGHKGTIFVRAFYYLNGKFMPLNMIIAILEGIKDEKTN